MRYEELHHRYGAHVSQRVRRALSMSEFNRITLETLPIWLQARAETAHEEYSRILNNPLAASEFDEMRAGNARQFWKDAEDLAYLVVIAENVGENARAV